MFGFGRLRANSALDSPQAAANAAYAGRRPSLPDPDLMPPTPPPRKSKGGGRPSSAGSGSGSGGPSTVELKPKRLGSKMSLLGLFKRPSADLARAAVRGVCVAEGRRVPRAAATPFARVGGVDLRQALHQSQLGLGLPDHAHAVDNDEVGGVDRRRSHHGMLVDHTLFEPAGAIEGPHRSLEALRQAERKADGACFVDAFLARPDQRALRMFELAAPHADDEVGLRAICTVRRHTAPVGDAFYSVNEEVALAVGWSDGDEDSSEGYIDRLVTVLEKSRVPGDRLADRRGLVLDYGPWLREMGRVEEVDAAAAEAAALTASGRRVLRGRQTANSTGRRAVVGERWRELEATGLEFGII